MTYYLEKFNGSTWNSLLENPRCNYSYKSNALGVLNVFSSYTLKDSVSGGDELRLRDDSLGVLFRGFSRSSGKIGRGGELSLEVRGVPFDVIEDYIELSVASNTDNLTELARVFSGSGYNLVVPSGVTGKSISSYSFKGARFDAARELLGNYGFRAVYKADGDVLVEPEGFTSSGISFDLVDGNAQLQNYESENADNLVTSVRVIGVDGNGDAVDELITTTTNLKGRNKVMKITYPLTSSEAVSIGESNLKDDLIDKLKIRVAGLEAGAVLVNQVVSALHSGLGINGSFVVKKQDVYLPNKEMILELGSSDEEEAFDERSFSDRGLREERSIINADGNVDVGGQGLSGTTDSHDHNARDFNGHPHFNPSGTSNNSDIDTDYNFRDSTGSAGQTLSLTRFVPYVSGQVDYALIMVNLGWVDFASPPSGIGCSVEIENLDTNDTLLNDFVIVTGGYTSMVVDSSAFEGDDIRVTASFSGGIGNTYLGVSIQSIARHSHDLPSGNTNDNQANVTDSNRTPGLSGSTSPKFLPIGINLDKYRT